MGRDDDTLRIGAVLIGNHLWISDPSGNDKVIINNTTVTANTYIYLTSGLDKVFIAGSGTIFGNNLFINTGDGHDLVRFIPGLSQVGNNLGIYTGGDNDQVIVDGSGTTTPLTLQVSGTTDIRTGQGDDLVRFGTRSTTGLTVDLQGTVIDTGDGNDRIYMRDAIMKLLIALLGNGNDQVLNIWGTANVMVGFGSLLDGGNHVFGDTLPSPWTPPTNLTVVNFP